MIVRHTTEGRRRPLMGGHGCDAALMKLGPGVEQTRLMGKRLQYNKKGLGRTRGKAAQGIEQGCQGLRSGFPLPGH